jgi:hypothetical protein
MPAINCVKVMVGLSEAESLSVLGEEQLEQGISAHEKNRQTSCAID